MRDLAVLLAVALLTFGLDRLGAFTALAAMLETPEAAAEEGEALSLWPGESADYLPPAPAPDPAPEVISAEGREILEALSQGDLRSASSLAVDQLGLLREGWSYSIPAEGPQVLIFHTHSCEAYTPQGEDTYEASGEFRGSFWKRIRVSGWSSTCTGIPWAGGGRNTCCPTEGAAPRSCCCSPRGKTGCIIPAGGKT